MKTETYSKKIADDLITWIRDYASSRLDSTLADENSSFPPHIFLDLGNQGFFGMHVSRKYGGLELTTTDMLRVIEQVAAIDLTLTVILIESIQGAHTLENYGTQDMKDHYLPLLAKGRILIAGAMSESAAGSNPRAMKSVAVKEAEDKWLLKGSKRWVGMGSWANVIAIYVHEVDKDNNWQGMNGFLVPQGFAGLHIGPESTMMGMRGFAKNTIYMDNVAVSSEQLIGKPHQGMEIAQANMMYVRLCLAAASLGAMKRCLQLMLRYAEQRSIATGQLIDNPVTLVRLSEMTSIIDALENFIYIISSLYDTNPAVLPEEAFVVAKILGSEYLGWMADSLVQTLGARGYEEANGTSQLFRDARVFRIFEGPTEALNMYVGSRILEKNSAVEYFFNTILQQPQLFKEIRAAVNKVNQYCLTNKQIQFSNSFSIHYWSQSLVGEILSYGLLLGVVEYSLKQSESKNSHRAALWARDKYKEVVTKALTCLLGEKLLLQPQELKEFISKYNDSIGNIEQSRIYRERSIDYLLRCDLKEVPDYTSCEEELLLAEGVEPRLHDGGQGVVTEAERKRLLHEWNNLEKQDVVPTTCVHELFEEQVKRNAKATAVTFESQSISYEELNERANQLANYLKKRGIEGNKLVAIHLKRSIEMIVSLLAILKAGGAYLPLDHNYPAATLEYMLKDSGAEMLLTEQNLAKSFKFDAQKIVVIEEAIADISNLSKDFTRQANLDSVCYVLYTSGSSGRPKGVMLPHRALSNLLMWHVNKVGGKRTILQFTTLNFDMSFLEIFAALLSGGTLVLISEADRLKSQTLAKIVKENQVQQLMLSVPFLKTLVETETDIKCFKSLKEIIVAGEQLTITPLVQSFFKKLKTCRLLNYYGPTETHVVTSYELPKKTADWPLYPPIGHPIPNTKILILGEDKKLVPIGTPGEIYIGGFCLSQGYINQEELTHEKFISDPWGDHPNALLYRSGDFGKYLPDGNIVYLGRKDEQVKIRGFRIEPQEIEANLMKYPGVKEAIVIAKEKTSSDKHLEAFIVMSNGVEGKTSQKICAFLQQRVPNHMIPAVVNIIEEMPLTASGKINRRALEKYDQNQNISKYVNNKLMRGVTKTEKTVIAIMENIFRLHVNVDDSFTSIGGNSLLAMLVVAQLEKKFSVELSTYTILSCPTMADIAQYIDQVIPAKKTVYSEFSKTDIIRD